MMKKEEIIEILRGMREEAKQEYKAEIKGIFGSYAREEQSEGSDIDIPAMFFKEATLFDFVGLANYLEEALKIRVDIVPIDVIREEIKENVLKEAVYL